MIFSAFTAARLQSRLVRALTTNPPWFRVLAFGMLIALIGKREFGAASSSRRQAKSEAAPATVSDESFFGTPLGFFDKAREGGGGP
jgi:hypothetical protein